MAKGREHHIAAGVVLLGSGRSRRMGRAKLLLPWGAGTVLSHLVGQWKELEAAQIAVVLAPGTTGLVQELDRIQFPHGDRLLNSEPDRGMFSSIQTAAAWNGWRPETNHFVIVLGDQPHLKLETLRMVLEFGAAHRDCICQPLRNGRPRHPVLLPRHTFLQLAESGAADLREFLEARSNERAGFECADPGLDFDMDTPADYEKAKRFNSITTQ